MTSPAGLTLPQTEQPGPVGWEAHPQTRLWYRTYLDKEERGEQPMAGRKWDRQMVQGPPRDEAAPCRQCGLLAVTSVCVFCAYLGWTTDLEQRLQAHAVGRDARLMQVVRERGLTFVLARSWPGGRDLERRLKRRKEGPRLCPICAAARNEQRRRVGG